MLAILNRELVGAEIHYHWSCYHFYTKKDTLQFEEQAATDEYDTTETITFAKLYEYIRLNIFEEPQVMKIANLTMKVIE